MLHSFQNKSINISIDRFYDNRLDSQVIKFKNWTDVSITSWILKSANGEMKREKMNYRKRGFTFTF